MEGENVDDVSQNTLLGSFELSRDLDVTFDLKKSKVTDVKVEVQMWLDADGVIAARVHDTLSGQSQSIRLSRNRKA